MVNVLFFFIEFTALQNLMYSQSDKQQQTMAMEILMLTETLMVTFY